RRSHALRPIALVAEREQHRLAHLLPLERRPLDAYAPTGILWRGGGHLHELRCRLRLVLVRDEIYFCLGTRPSRKNSSLGRRPIMFAMRFDRQKNAEILPMSQMSSSSEPW